MAISSDQIEWLHSLMQELENSGVELPMGDYAEVYDIIEGVREEVDKPSDPYTPLSVQDPMLVDATGSQPITVNVIPGNMAVDVSRERLALRFWWDDSDGDPHAVIDMTYDEWREFAEWMPHRQ